MQVAMHGKNQSYQIRIGEFPGQVSNYFDQFADAEMTEHCYYDQSTRAIVRDCKERITNFFKFSRDHLYEIYNMLIGSSKTPKLVITKKVEKFSFNGQNVYDQYNDN